MRLTAMTDYALRQLIYVAERPGRLCTIAEIADAHGISNAHLMKITHQLSLSGWIETVRGKGGGMRLALPARDIPLGSVVRCFEPHFDLVECFSTNNQCRLTRTCRLSGVLNNALQQFFQHLDRHTLADLLPATEMPLRDARTVPRKKRLSA